MKPINRICSFSNLVILNLIIFLIDDSYSHTLRRLPRSRQGYSYLANDTACTVDDIVYREGDSIPTGDPCEICRCRPPGFHCVVRDCPVKPGCKAIRREGECCHEYQCGCEYNGKYFNDGETIPFEESRCYACICQGSSITCALLKCEFRMDCEPEYIAGECCPRYDHCRQDTNNSLSDSSDQFDSDSVMLIPPGDFNMTNNDQSASLSPPSLSHTSSKVYVSDTGVSTTIMPSKLEVDTKITTLDDNLSKLSTVSSVTPTEVINLLNKTYTDSALNFTKINEVPEAVNREFSNNSTSLNDSSHLVSVVSDNSNKISISSISNSEGQDKELKTIAEKVLIEDVSQLASKANTSAMEFSVRIEYVEPPINLANKSSLLGATPKESVDSPPGPIANSASNISSVPNSTAEVSQPVADQATLSRKMAPLTDGTNFTTLASSTNIPPKSVESPSLTAAPSIKASMAPTVGS